MARSRKKSSTTVSLFPFLSILACIMGTLTLIISGLVFGQIGSTPAAEVYKIISDEISRDSEEIKQLKQLITEASSVERQLSEYRRQVERLKSTLPGLPEDMESTLAILQKIKGLHEKVKEAEGELKRRKDEIVRLRIKIEDKQESQNIIVLKPTGLGKALKPSFVECRANDLIIYPQGGRTFRDHAKYIKRQSGWSIVFLIRPDGIKKFEEAQRVARQLGVPYGYLPLPQNGKIDFSLWKIESP